MIGGRVARFEILRVKFFHLTALRRMETIMATDRFSLDVTKLSDGEFKQLEALLNKIGWYWLLYDGTKENPEAEFYRPPEDSEE